MNSSRDLGLGQHQAVVTRLILKTVSYRSSTNSFFPLGFVGTRGEETLATLCNLLFLFSTDISLMGNFSKQEQNCCVCISVNTFHYFT